MSHGVGSHLVRTWIAPIDDFKIDSEEIKHTRLRIADSDMIGVDMVLGADFFLSHRVYVSNLQHKLYLTYNGGPVFKLTEPAVAQAAPDATPQPPAPPTDLGPAPTDAEGFSRRGAALAARRQFDSAIADFTHACALAPTESRYFHQRATAYLENKQPDLAMADLDQTLKLNPDDIGARLERAELHLFKKDKAAAILDLDAAATLAAPQEDFRLHLAVLYERVDRLADAIAQYDLWIAAHEEDARMVEAFNGRCWDRTLIGTDLDKALKDCNRALSALPKSPHILDSRGLVFLRMGRFDKAINDYNAALAQDRHIAWSLYGRGLAELALGQKPAGQADIAAALVIDPKIADDFKRHGMVAPAQS
jgi:tetratricopeptide (TPR) repeat protein